MQLRSRQIAAGADRDLRAAGDGGGQGARAARGRGARPAAAQHHRVGAEHHGAEQPGQGRVPARRCSRRRRSARWPQAEAEKVARVGIAQAIATEEQVRAYGGPQYQVTQQVMNRFAEAIQQARVDVVPRVLIGGEQGRQRRQPDGGSAGHAALRRWAPASPATGPWSARQRWRRCAPRCASPCRATTTAAYPTA